MKKLLLSLTAVGLALLTSCGESPEPPELPKVHYWRSTHQYFSRSLDDSRFPYPEKLRESVNLEVSVDLSEEESFQLALCEDGTGSGSGARYEGIGGFGYSDFSWQLSEDKPVWWPSQAYSDSKWLLFTKIGYGYGGVFVSYDGVAREEVSWIIEECTDDKMVLSTYDLFLVDGIDMPWRETHTYRYTFEKVE